MNIIEPDVFYSDIALGIILLVVAYISITKPKLAWSFVTLGTSTFFGAFYHGFYNTTQVFIGDILWSITMILYTLSSFLFIHFALQKHISLTSSVIGTIVFSLFTTLVNESFVYGLILQALAITILGHLIYKNKVPRNLYFYISFVLITLIGIYVQQQKINLGLNYSHNTLFHIIQIPAIVLLFLSLKNSLHNTKPN